MQKDCGGEIKMDNQTLLAERKDRISKATALEKTDRTPVVLEMAGKNRKNFSCKVG